MRRAIALVAIALLIPACGSAATEPAGRPTAYPQSNATSPSPDAAGGKRHDLNSADAPSSSSTASPPPTPMPAATFPGTAPVTDPMLVVMLSEQGVYMSLTSCDVACKALGSMEKAVHQICESDRSDGERCIDARGRLKRARAKVREACSICPEGPTTDPDAPI